MELQRREKDMLVLYTFVNSMLSKSERIEGRKAINEDLSDLLEEGKLSEEEYDEMHKKLDEIDEDMKEV
ncbi:hypothetical protein bIL67_gp36 [Lactococcus phage bIL67]|uniref:Uncharacterized protein n=1 Tax=Lactococcus phage bIL67 TaxID=2898540 RepID=Q38263_9CAUD|nr:hypothetical protein bIL67_gp36 [Lactococcus phage bIL67]AAA74357.1 unknown [Lactococcus phage bIL67]ANM46936.1 hypothetical protein [Lactococcus phage M6654]